jgi:hypothetical protein
MERTVSLKFMRWNRSSVTAASRGQWPPPPNWTANLPVSPPLGISLDTVPVPKIGAQRTVGASSVSDPDAQEFPADELAEPFRTRGPRVHVDAVRAMARARGRRFHLSRRAVPDDGSFEALVHSGLLTERGRLTEDGFGLAEVIADAPLRIRMHASAHAVPLIFEAHLFGGRALILATDSPAQVLARGDDGSTRGAADDTACHIGLDMSGVGRLPLAMACWAGLHPSSVPARREYTMAWEAVEARFTGAATPEAGGVPDLLDDQPWTGWAVSSEPAGATMTLVGAGEHTFRLTRPADDTAQLTWVPAEEVWTDLVSIVRGAVVAPAEELDLVMAGEAQRLD